MLLSQALRLLKSGDNKSISHMGFWLGEILGDFLPGIDLGDHCKNAGQHFNHLASIIVEARLDDVIDEENWKDVTNRCIYFSMTRNLSVTKAEKDGGFSMKNTWLNLKLDCILSSEKERKGLERH